jgi:hypothetical protein
MPIEPIQRELSHASENEPLPNSDSAAVGRDFPNGRDVSHGSLDQRISALEKSLYRFRLSVYCLGAGLLIASVLGAQWLFKQMVRRVDELSGSVQIHVDQRARGIRLNVEGQLSEFRRSINSGQLENSPVESIGDRAE